jgi:hypothetical protein
MAQMHKGSRIQIQLKNSPQALVDHINEVARGAGLKVSPYLCVLLERLHARPHESVEKAVPMQLVDAPPRATLRPASELERPGDGGELLNTRVPKDLADHMSHVAHIQGFPGRATYAYAVIAQAHGFPAEPVEVYHYDDPRLVDSVDLLGATGS